MAEEMQKQQLEEKLAAGPRWYVAHTYSGYENKVAEDLMTMVKNRNLLDLICDAKVPTETVIEDKLDKSGNKIGEKEVQHKIYPGYVFVKMIHTDDTWYIVRNTRGCTGFVGPKGEPVPLTKNEVLRMGLESDEQVVRKAEKAVEFAIGDTVEIVGGIMEGYVGVVRSMDIEKSLVTIVISAGGQEMPTELDLNMVKPL